LKISLPSAFNKPLDKENFFLKKILFLVPPARLALGKEKFIFWKILRLAPSAWRSAKDCLCRGPSVRHSAKLGKLPWFSATHGSFAERCAKKRSAKALCLALR
jgi:hypothetical protein